jgi:2-hydroxychromene-2-carboxylate isomerase
VRFPQNGLNAARLAVIGEPPGWTPAFTRAVFMANYADQRDVSNDETLRAIVSSLGVDVDAALARLGTEEAAARGIFGAPFTIGDELFWDNDRLEAALAWAKRA